MQIWKQKRRVVTRTAPAVAPQFPTSRPAAFVQKTITAQSVPTLNAGQPLLRNIRLAYLIHGFVCQLCDQNSSNPVVTSVTA